MTQSDAPKGIVTPVPDLYKALLRPLLFSLPPEAAQKAADLALGRRLVWRALAPTFRVEDPRLNVDWCGFKLRNPVGLAAGYDKNCERLPSLAALGFGYLVGGTVTTSPRPGNPKPRLLRLTGEQSLLNALGFPNKGLDYAARELDASRGSLGGTPVVVSVSGTTVAEIVRCHRRLEPLVDAVEVNISSPNTAGLRVFHEAPTLAELIARVNDGRKKPLMVKLPPYPTPVTSDEEARERLMALVRVCLEEGVDAVTAANSRPTDDARLSTGAGGLSGRAILGEMLKLVADIRAEAGESLAINACGGISTGEDAWEALKAGATTVQLLTGLIYRGPGVVKRTNRELLSILEREGVDSLRSV